MTPEEIDQLFARTLSDDYEDEAPWDAVRALRHLGSREVFDRAAEWCRSENPLQRARGADVLSQLGRKMEHPLNNFPEESFSVVISMLERETAALPMSAAIAALGHIGNQAAVPSISKRAFHSSQDVRFSVAFALGCFANEPSAAPTLLVLMEDLDAKVRDWATFGLGVLGNSDSEEIRNALLRRVHDADDNTKEEAVVALAKRKDSRILTFLITALEQPPAGPRILEAANLILGREEQGSNSNEHEYAAALRQHLR
jgi:HEAT repeat protein